jgi:hypothetical protein
MIDRPDPERTYEMLWDCPACQTPKLLGMTHRFCPHCGSAQDPAKRYFPADDEKVAVQDHRFVGADRLCPACGGPNSAAATFCGGCGSPLDGAKAVTTRPDEVERADGRFQAQAAPVAQKKAGPGVGRWILIGLVVLALLAAFAWFWKREAVVEVAGHSWQRSIDIEVFQPVSESAWCDAMPGDAYGISRHREQRSTRSIPDGQVCHTVRHDNGDGTFSENQACETRYREEPVYDDRCDYRVDRWRVARDRVASGQSREPAPFWPEVALRRPGRCLGCDREGARHETYTVHLRREEGKPLSCDLPQAQWQGMAPGSRWQVAVRAMLDKPDCGSLRPAN